MDFLAHIAEDGRVQTVDQHLQQTADLCARFAAEFHAESHGHLIGLSHDIGKYSAAFQARLHGGKKVDHATAGAIECVKMDCLFDAYTVIGHHSGLPDFGNQRTDQPGDPTFCGRIKKGIAGGIERCDFQGSLIPPSAPFPCQNDLLALSFWVRMLYSCLVDADYLDTEQFMEGSFFHQREYDSLSLLLQRLETYIQPWWNPKTELNRKRCQILKTCLERGFSQKGLYTLTVPTGGGKTIASLAFALKHAVVHGMQRVIYVVPYTSIIEQNAAVFKDILGDTNVIEHHSNLVFDSDDESSPDTVKKLRATENWDAPVIVTTAVQFFESMYANRSSKCRKLHNITNSVIIFDEAQMIPTEHLSPCIAAIAHLVSHFGSTAVLCTATQPVLNDLFHHFAPDYPISELCPDTESLYDQFRRVTFRQLGRLTTPALIDLLSAQEQVLCIVNSRKSAQEIFDVLPVDGRFHLSTLMYPAHRQEILNTIRNRLKENRPCRVVSTSLIEAGVDVDFPAVYREKAGLDSILQAAGRCNREGKRTAAQSIVSIYESETPPPLLFRINIGACTEALASTDDPGAPETINRYFTALRSLIGDNIDKYNVISHLSKGVAGCLLPLESVAAHFHLIDNATKTIYIPLGKGRPLIQKIVDGFATRTDYRNAGRYSVAVYEQHYEILLASGALYPLDSDSAVLTNMSLYSEETGLSLDADTGKALFI